ncbi:MAG TPA: hypothetical protein VK563_05865, partial [Puia sp.]|nr:hypothetical protein [Puia sp.]
PIAGGTFHDCCDDATASVLNTPKGSRVSDAAFITTYTSEYKSINRLLPVYKVSFERADGIRIYVETIQDRFAFAMDDKRRIFDRIFTLVHTWGWLEFLGKGKLAIEFLLAFTAFCTALLGICIFFMTNGKKVNGKVATPGGRELVKARRNHRYVSIAVALFTLMFSFSGSFHALYKFKEDIRDRYWASPRFASSGFDFNFRQLQEIVKAPVFNIGLVGIEGRGYWQINTAAAATSVRRDLMKDAQSATPDAVYVSVDDHRILPQGELKYARFLAARFSGRQEAEILSSSVITRFTNEYNFTDKRLPVWKISYATNGNERWYVETSSGKLSRSINDRDLVEGYSFAFFHKHEFMAWGGKGLKDLSTMFWALAQVAMVTVGLILWWRIRRRRSL